MLPLEGLKQGYDVVWVSIFWEPKIKTLRGVIQTYIELQRWKVKWKVLSWRGMRL